MEEITMERLLTNFSEVVNEFRQLVDNKDIDGVKKALAEVEGLLANEQGIELDRTENQPFDHVLHHFLSSIGGYIEKEEIIEGTPDITLIEIEEYRARILILLEERIEIENEIRAMDGQGEISVDDSIQNRIAEIEAEIARREEAWARTLQFTEGSEDRVAEYEKGTQKLRDELEKLKKQLEIAKQKTAKKTRTEETIEVLFEDYEDTSNPEQEKQRIANELNIDPNELEITWSGTDGVQSDDGPVMAYKIIRRHIKEVEVEETVAGDNSAEIERLKSAIAKAYEELELAKNEKNSPADSQWRLDLIDHIDLLKRKLAELENAKENKEGNEKDPNQDPSERKKALLERLTLIDVEISELTVKITEIEGKEGSVNKETFDVTAEVNRIGDKVFKTAEIRKELTERNVSREEFLQFYREGLAVSDANIQKLKEETKKLNNEVANIFTDKEAGKTLFEQLREAGENGDEAAEIAVYEKMRKKFLAQGYDTDIFQKEIKTKEDSQEFAVAVEEYIRNIKEEKSKIENEINDQELNKKVFKREIGIIEKELETIGMVQDERDGLEAKASREKDLRARQIRATMFGNEDLAKEYDERFKRFYSHKVMLKGSYIDENGQEQELYYETIENYPEYEEDAFFLNLEDYKRSLETVTKYRNSDDDLYALGEEFVDLLESQPNKEKAIEAYQEKLRQAEEYIKTFHGHTNKYKVKYENYMNAGSTLKGMVPVKDLPPLQKVGAATENVFRFLGIRKPEFTRIDENGNRVRDIKGGVMTLATDALVVGGVAAAGILGGPWGLAAVGTAYAAKGAVTAGNLVAAGITKARHKYDIEENIPTPYSVSKDDREVARKDYYRKPKELGGEGLGKFRSWVKAKNDRWLFRDRARETEERITDLEILNAHGIIDRRTSNAKDVIDRNVRKAEENQQRREENQRKIAQSKETYNDIIRDPDSVNKEEATSRIAQNAALRSHGGVGRDVNPNSQVENTHQYVKADPDLEKTEKLDDVVIRGGTAAATAITEEEKYTARQQKQDRMNRVATVILSIAGKIGLDFIKGRFVDQITEEIQGEGKWIEKPKYEEVTEVEMPDKISDLEVDAIGKDNTYLGDTTSVQGDVLTTGNATPINDPVGVAIQYIDENGKEIVVSIAEQDSGLSPLKHVDLLVNENIGSKSPAEIIDIFRNMNPTDISGSASEIFNQPEFVGKTSEEIAQILIKNGCIRLQNSNLQGWQDVLVSNIKETVTEELVGMEKVFVPGDITTITKDVVNYTNILKAAGTGAVTGLGITTADTLHEAAHQTKKRVPGRFDVKNPTYSEGNTIMDIVEKRQKEYNKQQETELDDEVR